VSVDYKTKRKNKQAQSSSPSLSGEEKDQRKQGSGVTEEIFIEAEFLAALTCDVSESMILPAKPVAHS